MHLITNRILKPPVWQKILLSIIFSALFGFSLGFHAIIIPEKSGFAQTIASIIKVPLLLVASATASAMAIGAINGIFNKKFSNFTIVEAAASCLLATASALMPLTAVVLILSLLENYSLFILVAYAGMSASGLFGCYMFFSALDDPNVSVKNRRRALLALSWAAYFGFANAELGWKLRPLVGWTGQSFTLFRHDDAEIFDQLRCEIRNTLHFGGVKFPGIDEESDTKQWPC